MPRHASRPSFVFRGQGSGFRVQGFVFGVEGLGFAFGQSLAAVLNEPVFGFWFSGSEFHFSFSRV